MSHRIKLTCFLIFWYAPMLVSCQGNPESGTILDKAIAAHGGEKNITKPRRGVLKGESKILEIILEQKFDLPKRWKSVATSTSDKKKATKSTLMVDGKLWVWEDMGAATQMKNDGSVKPYLTTLEVLLALRNEKVKLSPLKDLKVLDRIGVGFRAKWDDREADYYFDSKSGLLIQNDSKWIPAPGIERYTRTVWGNHKKFDGVVIPYAVNTYWKGGPSQDYELVDQFIVTELTILEKMPDDTFSLPKKN